MSDNDASARPRSGGSAEEPGGGRDNDASARPRSGGAQGASAASGSVLSAFFAALFGRFAGLVAGKSLRSDRFGTWAAILGVALGTATVNVVLVLDTSTRAVEARSWSSNPDLDVTPTTVALAGVRADGTPVEAADAKVETHEDYEVMRSAIRMGSLSAYLVGALIVFFTFAAVIERKKREVALYRSLGALPEQVAAVFVREAIIVAAIGAVLGVLGAIPLSYAAAIAGMTTTGRARIHVHEMSLPLARMALVALLGGATALLGVIRPVREILRLPVADALAGRAAEGAGGPSRVRGLSRIAMPFAALLFVLLRPFFKKALPSLAFFAVEAGVVCALALGTVVLVPDVVQRLGGALARILPARSSAVRLLVARRVARRGAELGLPVAGIMLVFALLLSLHITTYALKREVIAWAQGGVEKCLFVVPDRREGGRPPRRGAEAFAEEAMAQRIAPLFSPRALVIRTSSRTPWPNAVHAVEHGALGKWARLTGRQDLIEMADRFGPGTILLSRMMSRRYRVAEGDFLDVSGKGGKRRLRVVGVTDDLGFSLVLDAYRNAKTYGVIDEADQDLIAPYVKPVGSSIVVLDREQPDQPDLFALAPFGRFGEAPATPEQAALREGLRGLRVMPGEGYMAERVRETGRDFRIFDVILFLTTVLAAIGVANQLAIFVHARRREFLLYRTLGMTEGDVRRVVLGEGVFTGLVGGALAVLLGVPLGYASIGALRAVSAFDVTFVLPWRYVAATLAAAVALSLIAALYPARSAGRSAARVEHEG
jgi:putative ABC transport system permease protein